MAFVASSIVDDIKKLAPAMSLRTLYNTTKVNNFSMPVPFQPDPRLLTEDLIAYDEKSYGAKGTMNAELTMRQALVQVFSFRVMSNRCAYHLFGLVLSRKLMFQLSVSFISFMAFILQKFFDNGAKF